MYPGRGRARAALANASNDRSMFRTLVRLFAFAALAAAVAAGVFDGARSIADDAPALTSLGDAARLALPRQSALMRGAAERVLPALAQPLLMGVLALPAAPALFAFGVGLLAAAQSRRMAAEAPR